MPPKGKAAAKAELQRFRWLDRFERNQRSFTGNTLANINIYIYIHTYIYIYIYIHILYILYRLYMLYILCIVCM